MPNNFVDTSCKCIEKMEEMKRYFYSLDDI